MTKKIKFRYDYRQPPAPERRVAFCRFHKWHMTVKSIKIKECLKRDCCALFKNKRHPYWETRKKNKVRKEHT